MLARAGRRGWSHVEVGERGAQIEARTADDDRLGAFAEERVDLLMRELRVAAGAKRLVYGEEGDETVLEQRLLGREATPVSVSSPAYTWSASAETATGRSPAARIRSAGAIAIAVLPTPVGPKIAITCGRDSVDTPEADGIPVGSHPMQIRGSTVLLTGATGGIGQAIARELRRQGAALVLSGRNADLLDSSCASSTPVQYGRISADARTWSDLRQMRARSTSWLQTRPCRAAAGSSATTYPSSTRCST